MQKKMYRSRSDEMLGGVCAGLANYLNLDVTLVRLFFVVFAFAGGPGFLVYLILWIVIPKEPFGDEAESSDFNFGNRAGQVAQEFSQAVSQPNPGAVKFIGIGLVAAGLIFLLRSFDIPWLTWLDGRLTWPLLLIFGGILLLVRSIKGD